MLFLLIKTVLKVKIILLTKTILMVKNKKIEEIELAGGLLCLDFINSVPERKTATHGDYLSDVFDLIGWGQRLEFIDERTANALSQRAKKEPAEAQTFFVEAIALRELLYRLFSNWISSQTVPTDTLTAYNKVLRSCVSLVEVTQTEKGFSKSWALPPDDFTNLIAPIINDSYELLLSPERLKRLKECPSCGWIFYDSTKNGKRRWCSMKSCGSNVKALQWYYRQKKGEV